MNARVHAIRGQTTFWRAAWLACCFVSVLLANYEDNGRNIRDPTNHLTTTVESPLERPLVALHQPRMHPSCHCPTIIQSVIDAAPASAAEGACAELEVGNTLEGALEGGRSGARVLVC